jgi:DNA-binding XRE family transcriptional regulator
VPLAKLTESEFEQQVVAGISSPIKEYLPGIRLVRTGFAPVCPNICIETVEPAYLCLFSSNLLPKVYFYTKTGINMPDKELENIGKIIRQRRETLGITQEHLADISEVGLRTIRELERGRGKSLLILIKVADALGLSVQLKIKPVI